MNRPFAVLVLLSAPAAGQGVAWTVDDDAPADFADIQPAIDAASDGDTILVEPGSYGGFVIDGKSLVVAARLAGSAVLETPVTDAEGGLVGVSVENVGATQRVIVRGFETLAPAGSTPDLASNMSLAIFDSDGPVWVENCHIQGRRGPSSILLGPAILVRNSSQVLILDCDTDTFFNLGGALQTVDSGVHVLGSRLASGSCFHGVDNESSTVWISNSVVEGGYCLFIEYWSLHAVVTNGPTAKSIAHDSELIPGFYWYFDDSCLCTIVEDGVQHVEIAGGVFEEVAGEACELAMPSLLTEEGPLPFTLGNCAPNSVALAVLTPNPLFLHTPYLFGSALVLGPPYFVYALGSTDAQGDLNFVDSLGTLASSVEAANFAAQAVLLDTFGQFSLSSARSLTILAL